MHCLSSPVCPPEKTKQILRNGLNGLNELFMDTVHRGLKEWYLCTLKGESGVVINENALSTVEPEQNINDIE